MSGLVLFISFLVAGFVCFGNVLGVLVVRLWVVWGFWCIGGIV